jgi:hypothetical protein
VHTIRTTGTISIVAVSRPGIADQGIGTAGFAAGCGTDWTCRGNEAPAAPFEDVVAFPLGSRDEASELGLFGVDDCEEGSEGEERQSEELHGFCGKM